MSHLSSRLVVARAGEGEGASVEGNAKEELAHRRALLVPVLDAIAGVQALVSPGVAGAGLDRGVVVGLWSARVGFYAVKYSQIVVISNTVANPLYLRTVL